MAKIILQHPSVLLVLLALWLLFVALAWRRRFRPFGAFLLRLAMIVLVALALSQPVLMPPEAAGDENQEQLVLLVDRSASIPAWQQEIFQAETVRLTEQIPDTLVLDFADQPVVVPPNENEAEDLAPSSPEGREDFWEASLNPEATNLAQAFSMGAQMLEGQPGRLVLFSDGVPTAGDTAEAITQLTRQNIPVDVFIPPPELSAQAERPNEVRLVGLSVPPILRVGETFDVEVVVHSTRQAEAKLSLSQDSTLLGEDVLALEPGLNRLTFETSAEAMGPHTFRAVVAAADDGQPANNSLSAFSQVHPAPQILVVGDNPAQTTIFANWLEEAGFIPQTMPSGDLPDDLSVLEPYAGMVLVNVSARPLELEQMIAVQEFARSLGRGVLVTGGRNSFSLGQYKDTPLAELLPLSLEPPIREERPPVALLLIIDHSGSMIEERQPATRLVMAKEAAIRATNILAPQDLIGVLMFDNEFEWVVPFQQVNDGAALLEIQQDISNIPGGGGTRMLNALEVSIPALIDVETDISARHAVLFSDGKSYDGNKGIEDYDLVVDAALQANITLSTISIGGATDEELLAYLAERGHGRYHYAAVPEELPELTIAESDILRSNAVQEGDYDPAAPAPHSILRGFFTISGAECLGANCPQDRENRQMPSLGGYIAMTPKPHAEVALQVGPGDPLLGVWGYGLGRVAAWSSDIGQEWAGNWRDWPEVARFWGQVVDYTLPAPGLGLLQLEAEVEANGVVTLTADGVTATGQTVDLARPQATLTTPSGQEVSLTLRQVAPGRYQQQLRVSDPGVYQLKASQARPDETNETATLGFIVPYPAEYSLPDDGTGEPLLRQIAATTKGRVFLPGESLSSEAASAQADTLQEPLELWTWLLLAALVLWPLEIAWRRWGRLRIQ